MSDGPLHVVGFSGGIDSQACAKLVRQTCPIEDVLLINSDAGQNEHPLTTEFLHHYSRDVYPVVMISATVADMGTRGTMPGATRDRRQQFSDAEPMTFAVMANPERTPN